MSVYPIRQVTHTYYDFGILGSGFEQKNLRNRVAAVTYDIDGNGEYDAATHYSYDIHGNVHSMMQEMTPPGSTAPLFKQIDYEYDLVSGNVNKVSYQPGERDAFYHKYSYDADNRLTDVYTSVDNEIWQRDARYFYYKHGPLARVELAENKVQGIDYAYTLQGWLKGVNSNTLIPSRDVGADGFSNLHKYMGEDAFGYSLNYYDGDYEPITLKTTGNFLAKNSENTLRNLFNGNISAMVTTIFNQEKKQTGTWEVQPMLNHYTYDQLNRISTTKTYTNEGLIITNNWDGYQNPGINAYNTNFSYDANGNLLTLTRNGKPELESMDKLAYNYNKVNGKLVNNRLQYVTDIASATNYTDDIKTQPANNYGYDAIGNLTSDVQGKIINVEWNVANKITFIEREKFSGMENLRFYYDGMGNRILKQTSPVDGATLETSNTWYVRDAQGNIMATYTWTNAETPQLAEQYIYGSSRLGYINRAGLPTADNPTHAIGLRQYELTNHLGNVLTTVSDRPVAFSDGVNIPVDGYTADIVSAQDYYPFGSLMPGRQSNAGGYRFGFNGKEMDNEVTGIAGVTYDYGFRIYDARIAKFLSVDPLTASYPWYTPYQFAGNTPISAIDIDGLEPSIVSTNYNQNIVFGNEQTVIAISNHQSIFNNINWNGYAVNSIFDIQEKVKEVKHDGTNIKNLYIQGHGGSGYLDFGNGMNATSQNQPVLSEDQDGFATFSVTAGGIEKYMAWKNETDEEEKMVLYYDNELSGSMGMIMALEEVLSAVDDGGTVVFGGCFAANTDQGQGDITTALGNLSGNRLKIYANQDGTRVNRFGENFLDTMLSGSNLLKGWKNKNGSSSTEKTGKDLIIQSGGDPVKEL